MKDLAAWLVQTPRRGHEFLCLSILLVSQPRLKLLDGSRGPPPVPSLPIRLQMPLPSRVT
jgi:hypothetical protein